jgi:phosphoserine phosphatase RsbU/P
MNQGAVLGIRQSHQRLRYNILFEMLTDFQFDELCKYLEERSFQQGEVILHEDTESDELFLLIEGRVKIIRKTKTGDEYMLALLHPGDFFGEMEVIDGRSRSADVIAEDDCLTYVLPKKSFDWLLKTNLDFAGRLAEILSIRLRAMNYQFIAELERSTQKFLYEYQKMERLIEAVTILNSTLNLDELLKLILDIALEGVNGERGTLYLLSADRKELWSKVFIGSEQVKIQLQVGHGIAGYVAATGDVVNIKDAYLDPRFNPEIDKITGFHTQSMLCMPMKNKQSDIIGVFQLLNKKNHAFNEEDESFIAALSIHASLAIENARLYKQEQEKINMEKEMLAAGEVQKSLFPTKLPTVPGYEFAACNIPARTVSGDLYDFFTCTNDLIAFCLGDVSGKGLPASLLMANLQASLRNQQLLNLSAADCINRSNNILYANTSSDKFITLFYGLLDPENHEFHFVNAGHDFPYFFANGGTPIRLNTEGIPIGIIENYPYRQDSMKFQIGDLLLVYSDGICEAMNPNHQPFGEERLENIVRDNRDLSPGELLDVIIKEVKLFTQHEPQMDDITLVAIRRSV